MSDPSLLAPRPPADLLDGASLFLDFDGTLVDIAATPDAVAIEARLPMLLQLLGDRLGGRLAIVTGRAASEIGGLLSGPACTVVGSHGMEFHWIDGRRAGPERPRGLDGALEEVRALANRSPGLIVENKPLGVALHFRQAPHEEAACLALAERLAEQHGLHLQLGKMMVEVRAGGGDKGEAIRTLMAEPPFRATRPVFMGDDLTDEPGFVAAAELGGAGVLIGPERPTAALHRLGSVAETLEWLQAQAGRHAQ